MWKLKLALHQAKQWARKNWLALSLAAVSVVVLKSMC